ncbi:MAG: bifunctional methylenetetrahydrofolate dehydrogenase/methenyltetrahydrofolate cyclohydrolase FolD [Planctomycetes bacterium]|nr:bifunctional methylenetetrahydrofolate dehydrogenase/methenyltetrahydrofolate cyclohydrolase FolD [Planctomycetota bacterium]
MARIIDGKLVANSILEEVRGEIKLYRLKPRLEVVLAGDNPASLVYVKMKKKAARKVGISSKTYKIPPDITEEKVLKLVRKLNSDRKVHGILIQLPLPKQVNEEKVIASISPSKDVDGFTPVNMGKLLRGNEDFSPCTPYGVLALLEKSGIEIAGKHAVVLGRSNIVGKPMALMLLKKNATVTICHSKTKNLEQITRSADVLIVAIGKPEFVTGDMVKKGAVVIDVGINRLENKLVGDVNFNQVSKKASYITTVPGGVGPMTVAMLMKNTVTACRLAKQKK